MQTLTVDKHSPPLDLFPAKSTTKWQRFTGLMYVWQMINRSGAGYPCEENHRKAYHPIEKCFWWQGSWMTGRWCRIHRYGSNGKAKLSLLYPSVSPKQRYYYFVAFSITQRKSTQRAVWHFPLPNISYFLLNVLHHWGNIQYCNVTFSQRATFPTFRLMQLQVIP